MGLIPDQAKCLPPPGIVNRNSLWLGGVGWCTAMIHNAMKNRPPLKSGAHRQVLCATIGFFVGYYVTKYENYIYAKLDREMSDYITRHPDDFPVKDKKTFAEITEPFIPVR